MGYHDRRWKRFGQVMRGLCIVVVLILYPECVLGFTPLKFNPSLSITELIEDNVLLPYGGDGADTVTTARPEVSLTIPLKRAEGKISGGLTYVYSQKYEKYKSDYPEQEEMKTLTYDALASLSFYFLKDLLFSFSYNYAAVPIYLYMPSESPANITQMSEGRGSVTFQHSFSPRTSFTAAYGAAISSYSEPVGGQSVSHNADVGFKWGFSRPIGLLLKYSILSTSYDGDTHLDSTIQQPAVGLVSSIKDLEGEISVGYQIIKWDQEAPETGNVVLAKVKYAKKIAKVSLEGLHRTTIDLMGREYKDTGGALSFSVLIGSRVELMCEGRGGEQEFDEPPLKRQYLQAGGGITFKATKWLFSSLGYTHFQTKGEDENEEYSNNIISISLRLGL